MTNRLLPRLLPSLSPRLALRTAPLALALAAACLLAPASIVAAQDDQTAPAKPGAAKPAGDPAPQAERAKDERPRERFAERPPELLPTPLRPNIRVEVTITDQSGTGKPIVKTLSAVMSDKQDASVRTEVHVPAPVVTTGTDPKSATVWRTNALPLNVDLRSEVTENRSFARVSLSLNYGTAAKQNDAGTGQADYAAQITQKFNVFLESGKPMIISQSADAATDRKVTIELKATILK